MNIVCFGHTLDAAAGAADTLPLLILMAKESSLAVTDPCQLLAFPPKQDH